MTGPPIVITGFMGAGKTTVARALARRLGGAALDLDALVAALGGRTPGELIDAEGEAAFRRVERAALARALADPSARVVALGGGTWTVEANRAMILARGCAAVWLDAPFDLCWERVRRDGVSRPLARERGRARRLYEARRGVYALAPHRLEVAEGAGADELAGGVLELLARGRINMDGQDG